MTLAIPMPDATEHSEAFGKYVRLAPESDVAARLEAEGRALRELLAGLGEAKAGYRYAEGKWSLKELLGHLSDAERVFTYRLLCVARGEQANLPGFEEDDYVREARFERRSLASLLAEHAAVRAATVTLLESLEPADLERRGTSNGKPITVRALAHVMLGHERHHHQIVRERYLPGLA